MIDYEIEFLEAKNHERTVKVNDFLLHSFYSPTREAQKFAENLQFSYDFTRIFILEPGIGYCIPFLKEKYPDKEIIVIKYTKKIPLSDEFLSSKYEVRQIFYDDFSSDSDFERFIYNNFNETEILSSLFISWPTSEKIFFEIHKKIGSVISKTLERSKTLLITRAYFEKKWLKNCCNNLKYIKNTVTLLKKTDLPVLIVASGPSLKNALNIIKENQNEFFIICLSSAISVLIYNGIKPDLCLSADGGFWAGEHLSALRKNNIDTVIAIPTEAFCQKELVEKATIFPLTYGDGLSFEFEKMTGIKFFKAERNGTVSGTALKLAQNLTASNIFFCGLDLHTNKGFQHVSPNRIENQNFFKSNRLDSIQKKLTFSEFNEGALQTYEKWFQMQKNLQGKIFRIIDLPKNSLNEIQDISCDTFISMIYEKKSALAKTTKNESFKIQMEDQNLMPKQSSKFNEKNIFSKKIQVSDKEKSIYLQKIRNFIGKNSKSEEWIKNLFPLDYISFLHASDETEKKQIMKKILNKNEKLTDNLMKTVSD